MMLYKYPAFPLKLSRFTFFTIYIFSTFDAFAYYSVKYNYLRLQMFDTWVPDSLF